MAEVALRSGESCDVSILNYKGNGASMPIAFAPNVSLGDAI